MDWHCCDRCSRYSTCVIKWYRGERREPNLCCKECEHYLECLEKWQKIYDSNGRKK
jgi:hypothetical protein